MMGARNLPQRQRNSLQQSFLLDSAGVGGRAVRGAGFQFLGMGLRTVITIGSTAVLARLLLPQDFGYMAMAGIATELAALLSNFGLSNLLVQRRRITRLQMDTVFWASLGIGVVLTTALVLASFFVGSLFSEPRVSEFLRLMALSFTLMPLTVIPSVVLMRLMKFRAEFVVQLSAAMCRAGVAIGLAKLGFGTWSLILGALAGVVLQVLMYLAVVPYRPRFRFRSAFLTSTWRTSGSYFGGGLLFYLNMNMDLAVIGRVLGATQLGYYQNARSLTDEVRARIAAPLQQVLFPAFSSVQHDPTRFATLAKTSARILAAIVVPVGFGVSALSAELVRVLYGSQWGPMAPVVSALGLGIAVKASTAVGNPILNALNRVGLAFKQNLIGTALSFVGILLAVNHGIAFVGVAIAVISSYWFVAFVLAFRLIGVGMSDLWTVIAPPFVASGAMWGAIYEARGFVEGWIDGIFLRLVSMAVFGAVVYASLLLLSSPTYLAETQSFYRRFRPARRT